MQTSRQLILFTGLQHGSLKAQHTHMGVNSTRGRVKMSQVQRQSEEDVNQAECAHAHTFAPER